MACWTERIERLVVDTGIRRRVDVLVHDDLPGPVMYGMWRPVLLFPADAKYWDDKDFERAAIHELEHVRRHDWATDCFARVVCAVYWFHPLVWITWRQLRLESERAADDAVVRAREGPAYADLLVTLAERFVASQRSYVMAMASGRDLPLRIQALLDTSLPRGRAGRRCIVLTVLLTASAILGIAPLGPLTDVTAAAIEQDTRASSTVSTEALRPRFEVIATRPVAAPPPAPAPRAAQPHFPAQQDAPPPAPAPAATDGRLIVLFFDVAITDPDDLRTVTVAGVQFVNEAMTDADLLAVMTNGDRLRVVKDFTSRREELRTALESPGLLNETAPDVGALAGNPIGQAADAATSSDVSLRGLTTLCGMLRAFEQRKTVLYFSAGMNRTVGAVERRAVTNACSRATVAIYTVDPRGLRFRVTNTF